MNLEKAIEILEKERKDHHSFTTDVIGQAERLGIEALKRVRDYKKAHIAMHYTPMPGETEE